MKRTIDSARLRRYIGIAERAILGLAMSLIVLVVERQLGRRIGKR